MTPRRPQPLIQRARRTLLRAVGLALLGVLVGVPASAEPDEPSSASESTPQRAVRLAWTGGSGGVDAGTYVFTMHERLGKGGAPELASVRSSYAWFSQGDWLVSAEDHQLASTLRLLRGERPKCITSRPATLLRSPDELLIFDGSAPSWAAFWPAERLERARWQCVQGDLTAELIGPADASPQDITWELKSWETRLSLTWTLESPSTEGEAPAGIRGEKIPVIGRPRGDGPRRAQQLLDLVQEGVIYVDAGRFIAGLSATRDDQLSEHRATGLELLRKLKPAALAPGHEELAGGAKALLHEAPDLPWVASNWRTTDEELKIPHSRVHRADTPRGAVHIAFLGAIDPALHRAIPLLSSEDITLSDPVRGVQEEIDRLRARDQPLDLVVVLSTASPAVLGRLRTELRGADLILGDPSDSLERAAAVEIAIDDRQRSSRPLAFPGDPALLAEVVLAAGGGLEGMYVLPQPVELSTPPQPEILEAVTQTRAERFPELDRPLIPAPVGPAGSTLSDSAFARLVCEAIRDHTKADVVFIPELPRGATIPGELSALLTARRLRVPDHLEVHRIPGDRMRRLLDQLYSSPITHCGTTLGQATPRIGAREIEPDRIYRLVTTDRQRQATELGSLLQTARQPSAFDQQGFTPLRDTDGRPRTLRSVAISALQDLRSEYEEGLLTELLARRSAPAPPRWMLRLRNLSVRIEGFQGADDPAYSQVPETLATSPSSFTIGSAADMSLHYDEERVHWDLRLRHAYTRLRTADIIQETADDLRFSSSLTLPGLTTPSFFGLAARPFGEGLLDSEWTPIVTPAGETLPRQLDLSFTLGLAAVPKGILRTLRIGLIGMQDLSRTDKVPNLGTRVEVETNVAFGPGLRWLTQLHATAYANTPDQDARDLRFRALLDSRVAMPLFRGLDMSFYGNLFAFQGRVPETSAARYSFTLGASLDARGILILNR
ncbi:MAG: hypothetical protein EA397_19360 [Deltaproteobacteria bacterium]|nr:MAG: hypothetical protein EA397_19360 [Deltaproteobacteria bacterium]